MVGWTSGRRAEIVYAVAFVASVALLALTGAAWGLLLLSIVAVAHVLPSRGAIVGTTVSRLLIAMLSVMMSYQAMSVIAWLCRLHATPQLYVVVGTLVAGVLWVFARRRGATSRLTFGRQDLVLLLPAVLLVGVYLARVILPSEIDSRSMIRATSLALDDTSHMAMLNALVRNDVNWLIDDSMLPLMAIPSHSTYPMGWHVSNGVLLASFDPSAKSAQIDDFIVLYFLIKIVSLALAALALTVLSFRVARQFGFSTVRFWPVVSLYTGIGYITVLLVLPQFFEGFFSFLGLMIYTLLFIPLVIDAWHSKDHRFGAKDVVMLLCIIASALTWLLTAPALAVTYLIVKLHQAKAFRRIPWASWVGCVIAGLFFVFQAWDVSHRAGSVIWVLASPGGINAPNPILLFGLVLVLVLVAGMKRFAPVTSPLFVAALPLLLVASVILGYIGMHSETVSYYFLKYEFILFLVLLPLGVVALMHALRRVAGDLAAPWRSAAQYGGFLAVLILAIPSVVGYSYVQTIGYMSVGYTLTQKDAATIGDALDHQFSPANKRIFFYFQNSSRTIMTSHVARTLFPNTTCDGEMFQAAYTGDLVAMNTSLLKCIGEYKNVVIFTEPAVYAKLDAAISPSLLQSGQVEIKVEPA